MKLNLDLEDIKYLKVVYRDKEGNSSTIKTALKSLNDREVVACIKYDENFYVMTPQTVTLSIVCNDGLYRTKTLLKSVEDEEPYLFFIMESPKGLEYQQNREYFRIAAEFECAYYINDLEGNSKSYTGKTTDISANGVSIILPAHAFSDEDAEIDIMVKDRIVHANVKYVRSEKVDEGYKLSFTYTKITNADRDYISQVCIKKQLEHKRNSRA